MNSSDNSSGEETDQLEDGDSRETRRSYECTFCRRGFTNAQALGGHMNIHRKDRAKNKAKQITPHNNSSSLSNRFSIEDYSFASASPFLSEISSSSGQQSSKFYSIFEVHQGNNYNMYFPPSSATTNPRNSSPASSYAFPFEYLNPRSHQNQELLGANLSLQIGPPSHVESTQKDGEVDLELRLGHHPY
ncbi:hypothetical protein QN277_027085 [Acacia crassicarpa]|uniref:C2H2-type domain-containing protein n=1 Tax=Acacia crassicarpa TaxID=499986 RepID=A0AAE1JBQ7_9FABA|nr:hypothetical protein QN277_027085 [Acacia crassicarpa]